jgi:uncharacterized protein
MHQYERNGVVIDQCGECRGIFLDRGELERLADAESRWTEQNYAQPQRWQDHDPRGDRGESYRGESSREDSYRDRPRKRKKQWIEELFD